MVEDENKKKKEVIFYMIECVEDKATFLYLTLYTTFRVCL